METNAASQLLRREAEVARPLPPELWLAIMRLLDSMCDHNAMARTCLLFAALARAEVERSKLRLARLGVKARALDWECGDCPLPHSYNVVGPFLANGQMHGRCCAYSGGVLICFEAYDDKRQGEARVWCDGTVRPDEALVLSWANAVGRFDQDMERSWHGQPFSDELLLYSRCYFIDDKLEGRCISYDHVEYEEWYRVDMSDPLWPLDWQAEPPQKRRAFDCLLCYFEDGKREDYIYHLWGDGGAPSRGQRAEHGVLQGTDAAHFTSIEDGKEQGMGLTIGGNTIYMASYKEHGVGEGWIIIYDGRGGVGSALYCEDGKIEGPMYSWEDGSPTAKVANFRGGAEVIWPTRTPKLARDED